MEGNVRYNDLAGISLWLKIGLAMESLKYKRLYINRKWVFQKWEIRQFSTSLACPTNCTFGV